MPLGFNQPETEVSEKPASPSTPSTPSAPVSPKPAKVNVPSSPIHDTTLSDTESINSENETPSVSTKTDHEEKLDLHRQPSLEEVEDEEFVMFRKKFGQ